MEINISNIPFILMLCERVYPPLIMEYKSSKTWKGHFPRLNIALDCFRQGLHLIWKCHIFLFLSVACYSLPPPPPRLISNKNDLLFFRTTHLSCPSIQKLLMEDQEPW